MRLKLNLVRRLFLKLLSLSRTLCTFCHRAVWVPWNVGVDNFGSVEEATHNRAHKAREIICFCEHLQPLSFSWQPDDVPARRG